MTTRSSLQRGTTQQHFEGPVRRWKRRWVCAGDPSGAQAKKRIMLLKWMPTEERAEARPEGRPRLVPLGKLKELQAKGHRPAASNSSQEQQQQAANEDKAVSGPDVIMEATGDSPQDSREEETIPGTPIPDGSEPCDGVQADVVEHRPESIGRGNSEDASDKVNSSHEIANGDDERLCRDDGGQGKRESEATADSESEQSRNDEDAEEQMLDAEFQDKGSEEDGVGIVPAVGNAVSPKAEQSVEKSESRSTAAAISDAEIEGGSSGSGSQQIGADSHHTAADSEPQSSASFDKAESMDVGRSTVSSSSGDVSSPSESVGNEQGTASGYDDGGPEFQQEGSADDDLDVEVVDVNAADDPVPWASTLSPDPGEGGCPADTMDREGDHADCMPEFVDEVNNEMQDELNDGPLPVAAMEYTTSGGVLQSGAVDANAKDTESRERMKGHGSDGAAWAASVSDPSKSLAEELGEAADCTPPGCHRYLDDNMQQGVATTEQMESFRGEQMGDEAMNDGSSDVFKKVEMGRKEQGAPGIGEVDLSADELVFDEEYPEGSDGGRPEPQLAVFGEQLHGIDQADLQPSVQSGEGMPSIQDNGGTDPYLELPLPESENYRTMAGNQSAGPLLGPHIPDPKSSSQPFDRGVEPGQLEDGQEP
ncbi:unnamed protein product [Ostreobium quekettii]|uniref:Uncharacterized protein n=1 Tax=Ostreobium quekettii TaxID=121088 RepID=A0A8S1IJM1_9CHLO|nr:unnamed protein product [Ostreobium quekettii]